MREVYEFMDSENMSVDYGKYSIVVDEKHKHSYGEKGMERNRKAAQSILADSFNQKTNPGVPNNVLLVGKIQSGKTSNLESLVALACDNGFNLVIMYGGYDNTLLEQSVKRFRRTFNIDCEFEELSDMDAVDTPLLFTTKSNDDFFFDYLEEDLLQECVEANVPIFIVSIKSPDRLSQINDFLENINQDHINALIIDDEGDQASLNNAKDKATEASATYREICRMKKALNDPLYFSVTATPQANIFLDEISALRPGSVHLLQPAPGYCGATKYHINDNTIVYPLAENLDGALDADACPQSLKDAVIHFLLASMLMERCYGKKKTDMIIHAKREIVYHKKIYEWIYAFVNEVLLGLLANASDSHDYREVTETFQEPYNRFFSPDLCCRFPLDEDFFEDIYRAIKKTGIVLQNGDDEGTRGSERWKSHKIYIGAQLLERGLTFDNLLTTYFVRWAKSGGNMDTNLQRARWFGYREEYLDLCKLFVTDDIDREYVFLAEMEEDLWDQFHEVEEGTLPISEMVVLANDTKQKPTRGTVADYFVIAKTEWMKQSDITYDKAEITKNDDAVERFISSLDFTPASYARPDNGQNCLEATATGAQVVELFEELQGIFGSNAFSKREIKARLGKLQRVTVIQMFQGRERIRSFYPDEETKIKALQQGRDPEAKTYLGDKHVVDDSAEATLQIYRIVPQIDGEQRKDATQCMFALFESAPVRKNTGFMRK